MHTSPTINKDYNASSSFERAQTAPGGKRKKRKVTSTITNIADTNKPSSTKKSARKSEKSKVKLK